MRRSWLSEGSSRAVHADAESILAAGGSLTRPEMARTPRFARRVWLLVELGLFYLGAPVAILWAVHTFHLPLFVVLQPILLAFIAYLLWDDGFRLTREFSIGITLKTVLSILLIFLVVGSAIALATYLRFPNRFLAFPLYRTELWQFVMFAYPVASVLPQELVYRTFFFHRYGPLFGDYRFLAILTNGLLFGFAHIIFDNIIAVAGTAVAGILFAYRYETTRSFWAVWLEHSLYGALVFTVGLGGFFFTGVSNL
ncbi:MAG: type II CAAX endopeptidase family protein [Pseudomonadota bacterium]